MNYMKNANSRLFKLTPKILDEARQLWLDGMGYRPMERYLNEKYPNLNIRHQALMHHLSPKYKERANKIKRENQEKLSASRRKEYSDSLKKLYGKK